MKGLTRVLVANRGEIALRIIRACADEGIDSVVALSEVDMDSLPALLADRAVCIGPAPAGQSYLDVDRMMAAAVATGCDGLHPGYGFLSERPDLAAACQAEGIAFVGPPADVIQAGGDKLAARRIAREAGVPVGAGSEAVADTEAAAAVAADLTYPVLLKAAAGGGGKGMVRVDSDADLLARFATAQHEAEQAFGDGRLYVEHYVEDARHVEVQVLADTHGNVIHLGERDCSAQRRYQKLIEEAPAAFVAPETRDALCDAAVRIAQALGYVGAGTVEFVVDSRTQAFSFLEVNTRVQVEHPVTEMVTGMDIVREQLRIAGGAPLSVAQADVVMRGHAIECRLNAEDPRRGFVPTPGRISEWVAPESTRVRVDTHCRRGAMIPPHYDSLMAKLVVHGDDRSDAIKRALRALGRFRIDGVASTVPLHRAVLGHPDYRSGAYNTRWIEDVFMPAWNDVDEET